MCSATHRLHDHVLHIGNLILGWPLYGLEATKEVGAGQDGPQVARISGAESLDHLSLCLSHWLRSRLGCPLRMEASCPLAAAEAVEDQQV